MTPRTVNRRELLRSTLLGGVLGGVVAGLASCSAPVTAGASPTTASTRPEGSAMPTSSRSATLLAFFSRPGGEL